MMAISEKKMQIVMNNYFKAECTVNTSIREAFEKGFRIGVQKGYDVTKEPEQKKGKWIEDETGYGYWTCSRCGFVTEASAANILYHFCPHCGADMRGEDENAG